MSLNKARDIHPARSESFSPRAGASGNPLESDENDDLIHLNPKYEPPKPETNSNDKMPMTKTITQLSAAK